MTAWSRRKSLWLTTFGQINAIKILMLEASYQSGAIRVMRLNRSSGAP